MRIFLPFQPPGFQLLADNAQRAHAGVADVGEDQFFGAAGCHHLIVDQVWSSPRQRQVLAALADDLMPGCERDQVGEPGCINDIAILHILAEGFSEGTKFGHSGLIFSRKNSSVNWILKIYNNYRSCSSSSSSQRGRDGLRLPFFNKRKRPLGSDGGLGKRK